VTYARKVAIWVAVLFIVATATSVAALMLHAPLIETTDTLTAIAAAPGALVAGVVLMFASAAAIIGIPIVFYPLLRRHSETGALMYFTARLFESVAYVLGGVFTLSLLPLARGGADGSAAALAMKALAEIAFDAGPTLFFGIGAMVLAVLLLGSRLVPRWLSLWKLVGGAMITLQGVLSLYGPLPAGVEQVLFLPIAVNEMVLAVWLIVRGFDRDAVAALGAS